MFLFFKQKTAYEMRISDWSSDVCSSDLSFLDQRGEVAITLLADAGVAQPAEQVAAAGEGHRADLGGNVDQRHPHGDRSVGVERPVMVVLVPGRATCARARSEEHTSELHALMRNTYDVVFFN